MLQGMRIFQVDAFTGAAFGGNPAAVCLLDRPADARWMQQLAAEMNLAETAFVEPRPPGYLLRWFTPVVEVALCGHATLASAHVLFETGIAVAGEPITFDSASGPLVARRRGGMIVLDFPAQAASQEAPPPGLLDALGVTAPVWTGSAREDFLVVVGAEDEVTGLRPDMARLATITTRGTIVTAPADQAAADFVSRFFAPAVGIPEDPVTGSAHCTLAPYWCERLGRTELTGYQASPRGGIVGVRQAADRILLAGHAVTVLAGQLAAAALPTS
jgi:PhzF family phenazine biosynthesis protein